MNPFVKAALWLSAGAALGASFTAGLTGWTLHARRRPDLPYAFSPFEVGVDAHDVTFTTTDGVPLAGWLLPRDDSDTLTIVCHGFRGTKADMLGIGPGLWRAGHEVLLFDFRGNGDSGDGPQSLAHHEQRDLEAALDWAARERPGRRIAVVAFSMGAATTIQVAARDPRIEVLVLDSPFATMGGVVAANMTLHRLPARLLLPLANLANRLGYGYSYDDVRPVDVIHAIPPRPILLLHGRRDRIIPHDHALRLAAAAGRDNVELVTFPADHCGGYFHDRPGYIRRVAEFLNRGFANSRPLT
ncbi:alpha/beta hydrolase [Arachnia propionica]|uniref:Alpha/beta hydrolase n=1 Tax=Arachnia propionica TaxID=1750 RepID=A0A3P1T1M4_9ACTN|nr:alpha/beta hydrolase [Arachnia propionica]RRD03310.1 alpha/beta hydrolase [Arachnia propionica]